MAKFVFQGLEEYEKLLTKLSTSESIQAVCGASIYAGADVMADAIRSGIDALPVVDHRKRGSPNNQISGITSAQKRGLQESFGVTPMGRENGYYNVKLGFDGYNSVKTKYFPRGQPNALIARAVNSGTSFRQKNSFLDRAVRKAKPKTLEAMTDAFDEAIKKEMK